MLEEMPPTFLFIAGAPRSGTTLLCNVLDGHKNILVFPTEHSTIERYLWNRQRIETYSRDQFITDRSEGHQVTLACRKASNDQYAKNKTEFGEAASADIDHNAFHDFYLRALQHREATLQNMLWALSFALMQSNEYASQVYDQAKWICFKQPFFTELFATVVAELVPNCKFIHLIRDPTARYASAKTRRLKQRSGGRLRPINRLSYVEGHSFFDIVSRQLSQSNLQSIGGDRYKIINFEEIVAYPERTFEDIAKWLGASQDENHSLAPTRLGKPVHFRSGLSSLADQPIDASATQRTDIYYRLTSWNERIVHQATLDYFFNETTRHSLFLTLTSLVVPFPRSTFRNYACQLLAVVRWLCKQNESALDKFLKKAREGKISVSGAT